MRAAPGESEKVGDRESAGSCSREQAWTRHSRYAALPGHSVASEQAMSPTTISPPVGRCPLCHQPRRLVFELPHTTVWQCTAPDCGLRFADPQLSDGELARAYRELYYPTGEQQEITFK